MPLSFGLLQRGGMAGVPAITRVPWLFHGPVTRQPGTAVIDADCSSGLTIEGETHCSRGHVDGQRGHRWYTTGADGAQGHQMFSETKAAAEQPEYFTFNGRTDALTNLYPLKANVGEKIRLFFGVGGLNIGSNFHVIGEIFDKVFT